MELSEGISTFETFGAPILDDIQLSNIGPDGQMRGTRRQLARFYKRKFVEPVTVKAKINPKTGMSIPEEIEMREVEKLMINVVTPGDDKNIIDEPAQEWHKREFWREFQAYSEGRTAPDGILLEGLSFMDPAMVTELSLKRVYTAEQLADASDALINSIPDGDRLRKAARLVVKASLDNKTLGHLTSLKQENESLKHSVREMEEKLKQMASRFEDGAEVSRPRGRPRKVEESTGLEEA